MELCEVNNDIVALSDAYPDSSRNDRRCSAVAIACIRRACIDRNRMLEEVRVGRHHNHRSDRAIGFDQGKVVSLRRSRVKDAEPVLPSSDGHKRLNLSVDDELVAAGGIDQFSASVCGGTEPMVDK